MHTIGNQSCAYIKEFTLKNIYFLLTIFFVPLIYGHSQNIHSYLNIKHGGNVSFYFDHLTDYQNGLTLTGYTTLSVSFTDTTNLGVPTGPGWSLSVRALEPVINGTTTAEVLNLNVIEISVGATKRILSTVNQEIASGPENDGTPVDVIISYDVGKTNKINIAADDEFAVNLIFTLESQ